MDNVGRILGILAIVFMAVGFIPCLGWLNWFVLLFAIVGIVLSVLHISTVSKSGAATTGIVLSCLAIVIGSVRLFIGAGIF